LTREQQKSPGWAKEFKMSVRIIYQDGSSSCHSGTIDAAKSLIGKEVYPDPDGEAKMVVDVQPESCPIGSV